MEYELKAEIRLCLLKYKNIEGFSLKDAEDRMKYLMDSEQPKMPSKENIFNQLIAMSEEDQLDIYNQFNSHVNYLPAKEYLNKKEDPK